MKYISIFQEKKIKNFMYIKQIKSNNKGSKEEFADIEEHDTERDYITYKIELK